MKNRIVFFWVALMGIAMASEKPSTLKNEVFAVAAAFDLTYQRRDVCPQPHLPELLKGEKQIASFWFTGEGSYEALRKKFNNWVVESKSPWMNASNGLYVERKFGVEWPNQKFDYTLLIGLDKKERSPNVCITVLRKW